MNRCQVLTGPDTPCWWPVGYQDGGPICKAHRRLLMAGKALRLEDGRQIRIAHDCNGNNPQLRTAWLGFEQHERTRIAE